MANIYREDFEYKKPSEISDNRTVIISCVTFLYGKRVFRQYAFIQSRIICM